MPGEAPGSKERIAVAVAVAALVVLVLIVGFLLYRAPLASETEWSRLMYLLSGVEAIGFAAAGFFFGREVYRARLNELEKLLRETRRESGAGDRKIT
jgi:hypothetical protein